ncbi:hypothetical protein [Atlantibacter sp.]|uniref:hypothetical protein n=1 Tax=Atlantibacter sp. TaxID=1903473 RepID=UPI0028B2342B|nr:hypothetical protein [Atlantibacter sp.]
MRYSVVAINFYHLNTRLPQNNEKYYLASAKLLMSTIDTMGFIEYDPQNAVFQQWLDTYSNIEKIGLTSNELYEFRNSLLHMTNLDSRKHIQNKVRRVSFYIGGPDSETKT